MDTELFKMLLTVINQVIDKLPVGISGMAALATMAWFLNKSKKSPLNISWGARTNGKSYVTVEEMRSNCEKRQGKLDVNLNLISTKLDKIIDKQSDHGERISNIEGELKGLHSQHRIDE